MSPSKLQNRTPEEYGEKYQDHLLEQYKLFVETSQHVSDKRQNSNNYLLTLNSSLVTLFVVFLSTFGHHRWNALIPATGLIVWFIWYSLVDSYKDLNTAKFAVIHELENQLPVALFRHEWWVCGHNRKKKDKPVEDMYVPLTHLERWIPFAFALLYLGLMGYALFAPVDKKDTQQTQPVQQQHEIKAAPAASEQH
ncbi:MAG: hypothetical protein ACHP7P_07355 [Terriglobales bacterium]